MASKLRNLKEKAAISQLQFLRILKDKKADGYTLEELIMYYLMSK